MTRARLAGFLLVPMIVSGCVARPAFLQPEPRRDFASALAAARTAADSGRWPEAERRLSEFAAKHPRSEEAHESLYWRGVFRLVPGNDTTVQRGAVAPLEDYLATKGGEHRTEARALLDLARTRVALERDIQTREKEIAQIRTALGRAEARSAESQQQPRAADSGLAEEVQRLKTELAKANQELERIRRRLAGRRP